MFTYRTLGTGFFFSVSYKGNLGALRRAKNTEAMWEMDNKNIFISGTDRGKMCRLKRIYMLHRGGASTGHLKTQEVNHFPRHLGRKLQHFTIFIMLSLHAVYIYTSQSIPKQDLGIKQAEWGKCVENDSRCVWLERGGLVWGCLVGILEVCFVFPGHPWEHQVCFLFLLK